MTRVDRDRLFVTDVLEHAGRALSYATGGEGRFKSEPMVQDAVLRCLEVIGEATKRVSPELKAAAPAVPWKRMAGLRDVLIHGYDSVDLDIVWGVVADELPLVVGAIRELMKERGWK